MCQRALWIKAKGIDINRTDLGIKCLVLRVIAKPNLYNYRYNFVGDLAIKVFIAEKEGQLQRKLADFLIENGFEVKTSDPNESTKASIQNFAPHFTIIDMLHKNFSAMECLNLAKEDPKLKDMNVLVTSSHNSIANVKSCINSGAKDYIIKPYELNDLLNRLVFHAQKKKEVNGMQNSTDNQQGAHYFNLTEIMLREVTKVEKNVHERCYSMTKMLAMALKAVRISLIECNHESFKGFVRASSDDEKLNDLEINLNRYPEVLHVMNTEKMVVLENLENDPLMKMVREAVKTVKFNAMLVAPVYKCGNFYGVLSVRLPDEHSSISNHEIRFTQMVSNLLTLIKTTEHNLEAITGDSTAA